MFRSLAVRIAAGAWIMLNTAAGAIEAAAAGAVPALPASELQQWEKALRHAGASPAEVGHFEDFLREQSVEDLQATRAYILGAPRNFFLQYLQAIRRESRERTPQPLFEKVSPVRSCARQPLESRAGSSRFAAVFES